jgi:hypothetical protein
MVVASCAGPLFASHHRKRLASFSEVLMVRVLCLLLAMILSGTCSALEIRRVAACSGVVLRLRGDFRDGDYARFKSQFRKKVAVIGLDLSSDGGDLEEGVQIANLAREKKLSVYVAEECNSICAFVFFSAAKRYLAHNSRIGVHSMSNSRDIEDLSSMRLTLKVARLSAKLGVPESAIGKLVTTPPSNITYLDGDDLSALGTSVGNPVSLSAPGERERSSRRAATRLFRMNSPAPHPKVLVAFACGLAAVILSTGRFNRIAA